MHSFLVLLKGDLKKSNEYRLKFNKLGNYLSQDQLTNINASIAEIEAKRLAEEKKAKQEKIIWAISLFLILGAGIIYFARQKRHSKSQRKTYDELLEKIKMEEKLSHENIENENDDESESDYESESESEIEYIVENAPKENQTNKKQNMSSEMEASLLRKLEKFERSTKFTDQNMSLASLAGIIGTNTQYTSELINKHKQKNFNAYINELRIKYVIKNLTENKEYSSFKIAYIAEDAGFSSHSVFSKVFKQYTDLSPSEFMAMQTNKD
ncbi:helix-turn-helix transcriptional regulator [Soonwooa sp.]|uniref:helix-turn-helix domain-containing protein n=1 Tax=Soonwooa sp. TaxID=1938592 RepID=UPI00262105B9|nr:helix-turn-helix transcriptional regulator [Soonwooa sp.]